MFQAAPPSDARIRRVSLANSRLWTIIVVCFHPLATSITDDRPVDSGWLQVTLSGDRRRVRVTRDHSRSNIIDRALDLWHAVSPGTSVSAAVVAFVLLTNTATWAGSLTPFAILLALLTSIILLYRFWALALVLGLTMLVIMMIRDNLREVFGR